MGRFIQKLDQLKIDWIIKSPTNSFLWELPYFAYAVEHGHFANCHACAFGSKRDKKTSFLSSNPKIAVMQLFGHDVEPHDHEPWRISNDGSFATSHEAEYPLGMREQLVKFVDCALTEACRRKMSIFSLLELTSSRVVEQLRSWLRKMSRWRVCCCANSRSWTTRGV